MHDLRSLYAATHLTSNFLDSPYEMAMFAAVSPNKTIFLPTKTKSQQVQLTLEETPLLNEEIPLQNLKETPLLRIPRGFLRFIISSYG